ncbi:hypothetical protein G7Y89_g5474 [Cudoniella acicularis]|uniref:DUF7918 domain-containing protein n=1 Tax=Cudoniella acicularis TaxID=354080 RepID=A0A8H4RQL1_9HELO|nr:hypothetical protein G7Y89_g5474 [Cudoniella acicularis]
MAIATFHPGITAEILVNGHPAYEYDDPDKTEADILDSDADKYKASVTISKYIKSETNQDFSIKVAVSPPHSNKMGSKTVFNISVDGVPAWISTAARPAVKKQNGVWEDVVCGVKQGKGKGCKLQTFRFVEIKTTDSTDVEAGKIQRLAQRLQKVGLIEITVWRTDYGKKGGDTPGDAKKFLTEKGDDTCVPERALKGGDAKSHGTVLSKPATVKRGDVWRTNRLDGEDYPLVIFKFLYRSEESLKQLQIIPRTPSPSPSPSPIPFPTPASSAPRAPSVAAIPGFDPNSVTSGLTYEQKRALLASLMTENSQGSSASFSGSVEGGSSQGEKRIKTEDGEETHRAKRVRARNGEPLQIDLTGEDEESGEENELFVRQN